MQVRVLLVALACGASHALHVESSLPRPLQLRGGGGAQGDNRAWRLRTRPEGSIKDTDLELCTETKPSAEDGQLLVKNVFIRFGSPQSLPSGSVR